MAVSISTVNGFAWYIHGDQFYVLFFPWFDSRAVVYNAMPLNTLYPGVRRKWWLAVELRSRLARVALLRKRPNL